MTSILEILSEPSTEWVRLVEQALWGTHGVRYRIQGAKEDVSRMPEPSFLLLKSEGKAVAAFAHAKKTVEIAGRSLNATYQGMLAADRNAQGKGYGRKMVEAALHHALDRATGPELIYAYVEAGNERSLKIFRSLGYEELAIFHAIPLSRFSPKENPRVELADESLLAELSSLLMEQEKASALIEFHHSLRASDVYTLRSEGKILAAFQVIPQHMELVSLPGITQRVALSILPKIPILGSYADFSHLNFLRIGNIYCREGFESAFFDLASAVLARTRLKVLIAFWDKRSPVYARIARKGSWGLLNKMGETPLHVMGYCGKLSEKDRSTLHQMPLNISPVDA